MRLVVIFRQSSVLKEAQFSSSVYNISKSANNNAQKLMPSILLLKCPLLISFYLGSFSYYLLTWRGVGSMKVQTYANRRKGGGAGREMSMWTFVCNIFNYFNCAKYLQSITKCIAPFTY